MAASSLRAFIRALPKTETHLHIEGSLDYGLLRAWDPARFAADPAWRRPEFRFESFPKFDEILLGHALPWFDSPERYYEAARVTFAQHVAQNVRYVETSFHLGIVEFLPVSGREIIAAIRAAVPPGLEVRIFAGMLRNNYHGAVKDVIDEMHTWDELAGIDLHGFEQVPTEAWSESVWQRAREAGKVTKCHAGEFDGAARVREAIEVLGVTRVQHGVRAIEDDAVVALAAERGVTFDVCPLSNVKLQVVDSIATHPLRRLRAAGVNCTVSSDDPLAFGNKVSDDYEALATEGDFSFAELADIAKAGWRVADVSAETRATMEQEIDAVLARFTA
ncbi:adenosine deaminase family protein [Actomonas aquatica]|uniref:Adenosine deaminase n=1 Tax=Actomonas aquatica TaxID=2866162 RepID=A0ABZ1C8U3_9BACT|nr:adenosine deaminase [Opitutus sp. WL0086]WRQ88009.1 adenosine deaminase [Opitutus sp. WL0086]